MLCKKCGTKIHEDKSHCGKCEKTIETRNSKSSSNSIKPRKFYVHSGKIAPQLVLGIPILLVITILLSFGYAYASVYIPYIYGKILLVALFVLGVGFSTAIILQFFKTRNTIFALCFGFISGIFALYASWVTFEYVLFNKFYPEGVELMRLVDPRVAWWAACDIAKNITYATSGMTIAGAWLWTSWGIEACAVIAVPTYMAHSFIKGSVFCEACKGWTDDHKDKLTFEYLSESELKEKLTHQDMSFLDNIVAIPQTAESFYRIDCSVCCTCENLYTLSLLRVTRTWSKEGKETDKEKVIMKNLFICKETFDKLISLNKPEPAPAEKTPEETGEKKVIEDPIPDE